MIYLYSFLFLLKILVSAFNNLEGVNCNEADGAM